MKHRITVRPTNVQQGSHPSPLRQRRLCRYRDGYLSPLTGRTHHLHAAATHQLQSFFGIAKTDMDSFFFEGFCHVKADPIITDLDPMRSVTKLGPYVDRSLRRILLADPVAYRILHQCLETEGWHEKVHILRIQLEVNLMVKTKRLHIQIALHRRKLLGEVDALLLVQHIQASPEIARQTFQCFF